MPGKNFGKGRSVSSYEAKCEVERCSREINIMFRNGYRNILYGFNALRIPLRARSVVGFERIYGNEFAILDEVGSELVTVDAAGVQTDCFRSATRQR